MQILWITACLSIVTLFSSAVVAQEEKPQIYGRSCIVVLKDMVVHGDFDVDVLISCLNRGASGFFIDGLGLIRKLVDKLDDVVNKIGADTEKGDNLFAQLQGKRLLKAKCGTVPIELKVIEKCVTCTSDDWKLQADAKYDPCVNNAPFSSVNVFLILSLIIFAMLV